MDIEKYVHCASSGSQPIKINKTYNHQNNSSEFEVDCFELKQNFFDPNKGSPPSSWTFRLLERIEKYGCEDLLNERNS
jgi:hypothetical protein